MNTAGPPHFKTLQIVGDSKYGGATYLILEWCKFLLAHNCIVDVLSTDAVTMQALRSIAGVNVISDIEIPRDINFLADAKAFAKLLKLFARKKYDVVHTYTAVPGVLGRIAARLAGVPAIFHHQAAWTVNEKSTWPARLLYTPLEYIATLASTRGICVSHAVAQHAEDFRLAPRWKLVTVLNGIDPAPFLRADHRTSLRHALEADSATLIIGATGRLAPDKDFPTLLRAASLLRGMLEQPFLLAIIGDGPDRAALETLTDELNLQNNVRFLGFRNEIPQLLSGMDVYVTTSLREGLSISVLEAMAAARPIVATSIPPNAELIQHEQTGLLTATQSPAEVAAAVARFAHEPQLAARCAAQARKSVLDNYTLQRMFAETWELYAEFIHG